MSSTYPQLASDACGQTEVLICRSKLESSPSLLRLRISQQLRRLTSASDPIPAAKATNETKNKHHSGNAKLNRRLGNKPVEKPTTFPFPRSTYASGANPDARKEVLRALPRDPPRTSANLQVHRTRHASAVLGEPGYGRHDVEQAQGVWSRRRRACHDGRHVQDGALGEAGAHFGCVSESVRASSIHE